jgi:hypothetical protein
VGYDTVLQSDRLVTLDSDSDSLAVSPDRVCRQLRVAVAEAGDIGNPEEGERPPLEAATKQRSEDRD